MTETETEETPIKNSVWRTPKQISKFKSSTFARRSAKGIKTGSSKLKSETKRNPKVAATTVGALSAKPKAAKKASEKIAAPSPQ